MVFAEFEEKQYETAFNIELGASGPVFASGQVLEKFTGYDSSASPGTNHALWQILGIPRPPGIRLIPELWSPASRFPRAEVSKLPSRPISFIVQFKRPEYLQGAGAAQYHLWRRPYYRFARTAHQHTQLRRLESRSAGQATIRYASPAFHRMADLEESQVRGSVVASTGFVSPGRIGKHKIWTYVQPGVVGRANPSGEEIEFSIFQALFQPAPDAGGELATTRIGLREHVATLAEACRASAKARSHSVDIWIESVRLAADVPNEMLEAVRDYAVVQSVLVGLRASWWLVDGDEMRPVAA